MELENAPAVDLTSPFTISFEITTDLDFEYNTTYGGGILEWRDLNTGEYLGIRSRDDMYWLHAVSANEGNCAQLNVFQKVAFEII